MMEVNKRAPVVAASEIEVAAPPEIVWDLIADIDGWPRWNPDVKEASLSGGLAEGSTFRWKAGSGVITSRFRRLERPRLLGWTGRTFGIYAIHVYRLEPRDGQTIVSTAESWDGWPARLLRRRMQTMLEDALHPALQALKAEAERRAAPGVAPSARSRRRRRVVPGKEKDDYGNAVR